MSVDTSKAWEERVKSEVLTRQDGDGDIWVLASDYAELLAERDAAYATGLRAGQEEMRERAAEIAVTIELHAKGEAQRTCRGVATTIRALPIKDKPDGG